MFPESLIEPKIKKRKRRGEKNSTDLAVAGVTCFLIGLILGAVVASTILTSLLPISIEKVVREPIYIRVQNITNISSFLEGFEYPCYLEIEANWYPFYKGRLQVVLWSILVDEDARRIDVFGSCLGKNFTLIIEEI